LRYPLPTQPPRGIPTIIVEALAKQWNSQAIAVYGRSISWRANADKYQNLYEEMPDNRTSPSENTLEFFL